MDVRPIPLVILAGSDRRRVRLPQAGAALHPLAGYKGIALRFQGRPLISLLLERARAAGAFAPLYVAGPQRIYGGAVEGAGVIDTDASFGGNIQAAIEHVRAAHSGACIAFLTCDVLPTAEGLAGLMDLWVRESPCDFFFPLVRAPREAVELGASHWKPTYLLTPAGETEPARVLPGHLVVIDPEALRLGFMYRMFQVAYRHRNRSIAVRRRALVAALLGGLLLEDLLRLVTLRTPDISVTVLGAGLAAAAKLKRGVLTFPELERAMRAMFVTREHRNAYPNRRVVVPLVDELLLAEDIDTSEEARERGGTLSEGGDGEAGR